MSSTPFQPILDAAFADYFKETGIDPAKHPFAGQLLNCRSPDDVLKLLENKANEFKDYREGNRKLIDCLKPVVNVIQAFSSVLGEAVSLHFHPSTTTSHSSQQMRSSLAWIFSSHRDIMAEFLSVLALATKQIKLGRFKKFARKLLGESEIEAVLQRLDRLTKEEGRMTLAQTLQVVHCLMNNVKVVMNERPWMASGRLWELVLRKLTMLSW
ncbi:hypothetical protein EI94DRAFT_1697593 [Lactarius quietus]|nr:hypothetical protein EI94DRAFT_1697593 [Lactarius quietus]